MKEELKGKDIIISQKPEEIKELFEKKEIVGSLDNADIDDLLNDAATTALKEGSSDDEVLKILDTHGAKGEDIPKEKHVFEKIFGKKGV